jgi:hypothetical protein
MSRHETRIAIALLALHATLVLWCITRNSVTFDENFHVPAGYQLVTRGDFAVSPVNPPLMKALFGWAALAGGARPPVVDAAAAEDQMAVGLAFMRANVDRYHHVFSAARWVSLALSLVLAFLVWRFARRMHGAAGGILALGLYATAPEALAHAGLATIDVATALVWCAALYAAWGFARSGRWGWWWALAAATGLGTLVRFSSILLGPVLVLLAIFAVATGFARHPRRLGLGLLALVPLTWATLEAGYLGRTSLAPLRDRQFQSQALQGLERRWPGLRPAVPDDWLRGVDQQLRHGEPGALTTYILGERTTDPVRSYFLIALSLKWTIGLLVLVALSAWTAVRRRASRRSFRATTWLLGPAAIFLGAAVIAGGPNAGVRYMLPLLPLVAVWLGGLLREPPAHAVVSAKAKARAVAWAGLVWAVAIAQPLEAARSLPYPLAFFNAFAGGPGRGDRLVNDSNVDWGQGLIALRDELEKRGIWRVHLAYHGTTDPSVYGIDYVPYTGGRPGPESEWVAISSYYLVGLPARMVTKTGYSDDTYVFDFRPLWNVEPTARPAHCMYLFHNR